MKKPVIFLLSLAVFGCDTESHQAGIPAPAPAQAHESSVVPAEAVSIVSSSHKQKTPLAGGVVCGSTRWGVTGVFDMTRLYNHRLTHFTSARQKTVLLFQIPLVPVINRKG